MKTREVIFTVRVEATDDTMLGLLVGTMTDALNETGYVSDHRIVPTPKTPTDIVQRVIFDGLNTMAPDDALDITAHDLAQEVVKALNQKEN